MISIVSNYVYRAGYLTKLRVLVGICALGAPSSQAQAVNLFREDPSVSSWRAYQLYHLLWSDHRGEKITKAVLYGTLFVGGVCAVCAKWLWLPEMKKNCLEEAGEALTIELSELKQAFKLKEEELELTQMQLNAKNQAYNRLKKHEDTYLKSLGEFQRKSKKLKETHRTQLEVVQKELNEKNKQLKAQKAESTTYMGALLALYLADSQPSLFSSDNFEENGGGFFGSKKKKLKRDKNLMDQFDLKRAAHALLKWFGFDGKNKSLDIKKVEKTYTNYQQTIKNQSPSNDLDSLQAVKP